jgi:hypothetical protein
MGSASQGLPGCWVSRGSVRDRRDGARGLHALTGCQVVV